MELSTDTTTERWALVLGCSAGAGAAIARALALRCGMNIIGFHRGHYPEEAERLAAEIGAAGRRCVLIVGDAGRLEPLPGLLQQVAAQVPKGQLRFFVHSVADAAAGTLLDPDPKRRIHPKQILKTFEVMAHSFLFWSQGLFEAGLFSRGSQILALPNHGDSVIVRGFAAIGASKAALNTYIHYMTLEFAPHGIRVNGLRFGPTLTDGLRRMWVDEASLARARSVSPSGRFTTTDDVADFVELLADDRAAWLNGSIIDLTGGWHVGVGDALLRKQS